MKDLTYVAEEEINTKLPVIQFTSKKRTAYFISKSNPEVKYKTQRHHTGRITCFCPGYVYNGYCWHSITSFFMRIPLGDKQEDY